MTIGYPIVKLYRESPITNQSNKNVQRATVTLLKFTKLLKAISATIKLNLAFTQFGIMSYFKYYCTPQVSLQERTRGVVNDLNINYLWNP